MKNLAVLTSGGDAPGMNAAIRAITRKAIHEGFNVFGIERGYEGILNEEIKPLLRRDVGGIITTGGTYLKTARFPEFKNPQVQQEAYRILRQYDIDHLVVIGGDGSMAGAQALTNLGMSTITIPCTIDNDMGGTQYTIGFDTAVNTVVQCVGKIRDTSSAHERVAIVEVMGRHAGHIALQSGLACGAEIVLLPEHPLPLTEVCERLNETHRNGKTYSVIIVAEGAYNSYEVSDFIKANTYLDPSVTVLGYLQRGGAPSAMDAIMAARMSELAIDALLAGRDNRIIGYVDGALRALPYKESKEITYPIQGSSTN